MSKCIEVIRIAMLADGDPLRVAQFQEMLREQEANGDIRILSMDDEIARTELLNPVWARVFGGSPVRPS